ncbi:MAG TPA: LssY C-terminal domain-containing protein [Verrucomicrobiae bacterium]|nr:LssY C-terminal domain-containing protein [Verrucomicrobiae bacterium]
MTQSEHKTASSWYANQFNNVLRLVGFATLLVTATILYHYVTHDILKTKEHYFTYSVVVWLLLAYVILPHVYRWLSKIFLPNYFSGRTQAGDGMLGDPVNLAIIGSREELIREMSDAGWKQADKLNLGSSLKMIYAAVVGIPYPSAPISSLFLFGNRQELAFEKDVGDNPRKRHHARFWKTPDDLVATRRVSGRLVGCSHL